MAKIKKILLINPCNKQKGLATIKATRFKPMAIGVLAGMTPRGINVEVIDENFDNFEEKIKKIKNIDIAAITSFTSTATRAYEIAEKLKKKKVPVIMGGIHVSFMPEEALKYCDSVVIGEAEGVWKKVLRDYNEGNLERIYRQKRKKEEIPIGRSDDSVFNKNYFWGALQTSRGCPMNCDFCSVTPFNGHIYRKRPVDDIIAELKEIKQKFVFFYDDNIVGKTKEQKYYALNLFKRMVKEKINKIWYCQCSINIGEDEEILKWMRKAGCRMLLVGFESVDKENLKRMNKNYNLKLIEKYDRLIRNIHKNGIAVLGAFMIGYPLDGIHTIRILREFVMDKGIDSFNLTHLTPFPGTKLYSRLSSEGRIVDCNYPDDWEKYNFSNVVYKHGNLSKKELIFIVDSIKKKIVAPVHMLFYRFLKTLFSTKSFSAALVALTWNLGVRKAYLNGLKRRQKEGIEPY